MLVCAQTKTDMRRREVLRIGCLFVIVSFSPPKAVSLSECDVYSYRSDLATDPFGQSGCFYVTQDVSVSFHA